MKKIRLAILTSGVVLLSAAILCAAEEESLIQKLRERLFGQWQTSQAQQPAKAVQPAAQPASQKSIKVSGEREKAPTIRTKLIKEMTKEDILKEIHDELDGEDEILDYMPEIKKTKDLDGKTAYIYRVGTRDTKLEELDKDTLEKILSKVYNQATIIRTDRINNQMETIRQAQRAGMGGGVSGRPPAVPTMPPRVTAIPPKPPQIPPSVTTPPKTPTPPPAPPRR